MECAICLKTENEISEKDDVTSLDCKHTFCKNCIIHWKKGTCPTCRVRFDIDQERYVEEYTNEQIKLYEKLLAQLLFCLLQNIQRTFLYRIQQQYATENEKEVMEQILGLTMSKMVSCYRNAQKKRVCIIQISQQCFNTETKISLIREQSKRLYKEYFEEIHLRVDKGETQLSNELDDLHSVQTDEERNTKREKRLQAINYTRPLVCAVKNAINYLQCTHSS